MERLFYQTHLAVSTLQITMNVGVDMDWWYIETNAGQEAGARLGAHRPGVA